MKHAALIVGCVALLLVVGALLYWGGGKEGLRPPSVLLDSEEGEIARVVEAEAAPAVGEEPIAASEATAAHDMDQAPDPVAPEEEGSPGAGSLQVRVVEEGTRIPLSHVLVSLWQEDQDRSTFHLLLTGESGIIQFNDGAVGSYSIILQRAGQVVPAGRITATVRADRPAFLRRRPHRESPARIKPHRNRQCPPRRPGTMDH